MLDERLVRLVDLLFRPIAHHSLGVQEIHRELDKHGAGHAFLRTNECLLDSGHHLPQRVRTRHPFHVRLHE
jgi:hypothetical protein